MMKMESDLKIDVGLFDSSRIHASTIALNESLQELRKTEIKWWQHGVHEHRRRTAAGATPFPTPIVLSNGRNFLVPTSDGRLLKARVFGEGMTDPKGVFYHIHGGGNVFGSCSNQDLLLDEISRRTGLVVVSVDYRLAPEDPYPAPREDCCMVTDWLLSNCRLVWNCDLKIIGGESAGATLSALVLLYLRDKGCLDSTTICGAVLNYGNYDISGLPTMRGSDPANTALLSWKDCEHFSQLYLPGMSYEEKKQSGLSAAYNNLRQLTSAMFLCGTVDPMLDDQFLMAMRWQVAGNEAIVKFVPGACHGFMTMDGNKVLVTKLGWDLIVDYINYRMATTAP